MEKRLTRCNQEEEKEAREAAHKKKRIGQKIVLASYDALQFAEKRNKNASPDYLGI